MSNPKSITIYANILNDTSSTDNSRSNENASSARVSSVSEIQLKYPL